VAQAGAALGLLQLAGLAGLAWNAQTTSDDEEEAYEQEVRRR
jgi:hypothetical protein